MARDHRNPIPAGQERKGVASDVRIGIAQVLALARAANVAVKLDGDRVSVRAAGADNRFGAVVESYIAALGAANVRDFLAGTTAEERSRLESVPPPARRRVFRSRLAPA